MTTYAWAGRTRTGQIVKGERAAESSDQLSEALRREQILVTKVGPASRKEERYRRVSARSLAIFTRQFSVMIDAGLPLVQCIEILGAQTENKVFQKVLMQVRQDVESGATLADSMRKHPKVFDELFCNMIAAGEAGGILDTILQRLANYIEKIVKLRRAIRSAMIYPIAVITIAALVVSIILWKVIPTFAALFAGLGAELPLPTRVVIAMSNFLGRYFLLMVFLIAATIYALNRYHKTYKGRRVIDRILLKLPMLGIVLRKIAVARFCRTLATLVSSGVPILESLEITAKTSGNAIVEDAIMLTRKSIEEGKTISEPLKETEVFPPMVVHMIAVGEQTGALDAMLSKIADFYEEEVDAAVENMLTLLEPIMILFLGIVIGGIVISMYLPMFTLLSKIG